MTLQLDVFLSWSGDVSRSVAEALAKFIRHVVPGVDIFVSSKDISAGERWMTRLEGQLEGQHHAILCLTSHNQGSPWINYEAGAKTPLAAVFAALLLMLILLLVAPLARFLPIPAMAGILFLIAWGLIDSKAMRTIIRTSRSESGPSPSASSAS